MNISFERKSFGGDMFIDSLEPRCPCPLLYFSGPEFC
ncbi:hypothetical protein J2T08_001680 [Neorhizobium galegae]|nr:hypothetical protein [Neorhizobium galegae]MDQ0133762.1 hypothetical protein [Neorhizobium galegae]